MDWITSSISSQQNCNKLSRHDKISCKMNIHQFPKCPHIKIQLAIQQYFWVSRSPSACRSWMAFELSGPGSSPATEMPVDQAQADSLNSKDFTKGFKKKRPVSALEQEESEILSSDSPDCWRVWLDPIRALQSKSCFEAASLGFLQRREISAAYFSLV